MKTRSVTFSAGMGRNDGSVLWGPGSGYCHSWHHDIRDTAPGTRSYFSWRPPSQIPLIIIHPLFHSTVCLSCHCIQSLIDWGRAKELRVDKMTKVRVLNCNTEGRSRIMHQLGCHKYFQRRCKHLSSFGTFNDPRVTKETCSCAEMARCSQRNYRYRSSNAFVSSAVFKTRK